MSVSLLYVTVGDRPAALELARSLLEARLVACANVLAGMTSLYRWEGAVQEEGETVLIAKTRTSLVSACTARILEKHAYLCPCVVAWPITEGNPAFLAWVMAETDPAG